MVFVFCLSLLWTPAQEQTWQDANQAYRDGEFQTALDGYLELNRDGVENGALHYNLGNAYLKRDALGKALLHYYKARKYLPGDEDLMNNIRIADAMRLDPPIEDEDTFYLEAFDQLVKSVDYRLVFSVALIGFILGGLASIGMILKPNAGRWLGYVLVIGWVLGILAGGTAYFQHKHLTRKDFAVVTTDKVDAYAGPSTRENVNFSIHEGIRCRILEENEGWARIRLANGYNGWVPRQALEII